MTARKPAGLKSRCVGLDIGSSAVRAAELRSSGDGAQLHAFGQVGLPPGAVAEGEVVRSEAVAEALRRLWADGGFSTRKVVVALGSQRVIVREADVTAMAPQDFRSAINFEVQDLIPIPVADAVLDFQILGPAAPAADGRERMRILLAAADRQAVSKILGVIANAGLDAVAIDVVPAALLRGLGSAGAGENIGLVNVGAQLTTVTVRRADGTMANRTLALGAESMTHGLSIRLGVGREEAESVKRYAGTGTAAAARAAALLTQETGPLAEQVIESLEYFQAQPGAQPFDTLLLSGGGSLTAGLREALEAWSPAPVGLADPLRDIDVAGAGLSAPDIRRVGAVGLAALGLARWGWEPAERRLSVLPTEILDARRRRTAIVASGVGLAVLSAGLGGLWFHKHQEIGSVRTKVAAVNAESQQLESSAVALQQVTAYVAAVDARRSALVSAAAGTDWATLVRTIAAAMPANTTLSSIELTGASPTPATTPTSPTAAQSATSSSRGSVTMAVTATGGVDTVATWLRAMATVPALTDVFVGSSTSTGSTTTFTCQANLGPKTPATTYAWEQKK